MERQLTVEFGPSGSKRFAQALTALRASTGDVVEAEPNRYRARFVLGRDRAPYSDLVRLLERVRGLAATDVYEGDLLVSSHHTREMAWCDSEQASHSGDIARAVESGRLTREDVTQLGAVLGGEALGRQSADDITIFDSTGLAIQVLAIAIAAPERADELELSTLDL